MCLTEIFDMSPLIWGGDYLHHVVAMCVCCVGGVSLCGDVCDGTWCAYNIAYLF